jgi:hypothetical protein
MARKASRKRGSFSRSWEVLGALGRPWEVHLRFRIQIQNSESRLRFRMPIQIQNPDSDSESSFRCRIQIPISDSGPGRCWGVQATKIVEPPASRVAGCALAELGSCPSNADLYTVTTHFLVRSGTPMLLHRLASETARLQAAPGWPTSTKTDCNKGDKGDKNSFLYCRSRYGPEIQSFHNSVGVFELVSSLSLTAAHSPSLSSTAGARTFTASDRQVRPLSSKTVPA